MHVLIIGRESEYDAAFVASFEDLGVEWTLELVPDATAALRRLQDASPDVVVSDLRPLGMEGGALLERVKAHVPKAARIMLLEERDAGQAMRLLGSAHRLLNKPLRAEELIEAVDSIADLQELLASEELRAAIGRIDKLPPPPKLYIALNKAVSDPDASLAQVASLVQQDPATAAKVLRVCNSAFFSSGKVVSDVRSAVIRLGQQEMRRIVLATEVFRDVPGGVDREAMRVRSLLASQLAGRIIDSASAEMAATAALMAEVGMLLPGVRRPDAFGVLTGQGPHYAEAGAFLLGMWGLPMPIVEAVAHHCHPQRARARGFWMVGTVHVACALASGRAVDMAYLESAGVAARLPGWRRIAEELGLAQQQQGGEAISLGQAPEPGTSGADQKLRAARDLLAGQPYVRIEEGKVSFHLLGYVQGASSSIEAVDAALLLDDFDAAAVDLCNERLEALDASTIRPPRLGWWSLLFADDAPRRLGRFLLAAYRRWRIEHWGSDPYAVARELRDGAEARKRPLWPIDLPVDAVLEHTLSALNWLGRAHLYRDARAALRRPVGRDGAHAEPGDLLQAALNVFAPERHVGRQTLYPERAQHMVGTLREQAGRSGARRVLVLVAASHLPGLRRVFRETATRQ